MGTASQNGIEMVKAHDSRIEKIHPPGLDVLEGDGGFADAVIAADGDPRGHAGLEGILAVQTQGSQGLAAEALLLEGPGHVACEKEERAVDQRDLVEKFVEFGMMVFEVRQVGAQAGDHTGFTKFVRVGRRDAWPRGQRLDVLERVTQVEVVLFRFYKATDRY